jgi:hypothetical protein
MPGLDEWARNLDHLYFAGPEILEELLQLVPFLPLTSMNRPWSLKKRRIRNLGHIVLATDRISPL